MSTRLRFSTVAAAQSPLGANENDGPAIGCLDNIVCGFYIIFVHFWQLLRPRLLCWWEEHRTYQWWSRQHCMSILSSFFRSFLMPFKKIKTDSSQLPLHLEAAWQTRCNLCLLHTACFLLLPHCLIPTYTIVALVAPGTPPVCQLLLPSPSNVYILCDQVLSTTVAEPWPWANIYTFLLL